MEIVVGGKYHLRRRVGAGSFGEVFLGENVQDHETVAIKMEKVKSRAPQLLYESKLYLLFAGGICVPRLHWFGTESNYNVMVIDYLGKSLEDLFQMCHQRFTLKTVLMIADQCIAALQYIHHKSFIHRDVKPDNFLVGSGERSNQIFIIDFGLSKKYRDPKTLEHMKYATGKSLTGTARYASVNALRGFEQSRRDDLESLAYCLIYFLRGSLPWMGLDAKDRKQKYERIRDVKSSTSVEELCRGLPVEFADFLTKIKALDFQQEPDYAAYREIFRNLFIRSNFVYDYQYDWIPLFNRRLQHNEPEPQPSQEHKTLSKQEANMSKVAQLSVRTPEINPRSIDEDVANSKPSFQINLAEANRNMISGSTPDAKKKISPRPPMPRTNAQAKKVAGIPIPTRTRTSSMHSLPKTSLTKSSSTSSPYGVKTRVNHPK